MRQFVKTISFRARKLNHGFLVIPQNGLELLVESDSTQVDFLAWIDGFSQEHLFYGQEGFDQPTPLEDTQFLTAFLDLALKYGVQPFIAEYCESPALITDVFSRADQKNYLAFAGGYDLDRVPDYPVHQSNPLNIQRLYDASNFLYLITPDQYPNRPAYLSALRDSEHDVLILDAFYKGEALTFQEVASLKTKPQGGSRLVIAYMNIGAAETWRSYWQQGWSLGNPNWLVAPYEGYPDEFWVRYWDQAWQSIILDQYLPGLLTSGFDGAYLDNILAFEQFQ